MKAWLRTPLVAVAAAAALLLAATTGSAAKHAPCAAVARTADFTTVVDFTDPPTVDQLQQNFTAARASEGCNVPLVLPADFGSRTPEQQQLVLMNAERDVRGLTQLKPDTLLGQIALNHSREMAAYGYFGHNSPISKVGPYSRAAVNPVYKSSDITQLNNFSEDAAIALTPSIAAFAYLYQDAGAGWGHRGALLNPALNYVGIGYVANAPGSQFGNYTTDDFGALNSTTTPPAATDTNPPLLGQITYAGGTATVTGVAASPANPNWQGATPATAGIQRVTFYVNAPLTGNPFNYTFTTVEAKETTPGSGTWTAPIAVNAGDVLHAVAVDGSGNFTDQALAPPAQPLSPGDNPVAVPPPPPPAPALQRLLAGGATAARAPVTATAAALAASIDAQAGRHVVTHVRVFVSGHWRTYVPGHSASFPLSTGQGVLVGVRSRTTWRPTTRNVPLSAPAIRLAKGWSFVAAPYPIAHLTCHAVRLELARQGVSMHQLTVGPSPSRGVIMRPKNGSWGNDLGKRIPSSSGFWVLADRATTWTPSATQYGPRTRRIG